MKIAYDIKLMKPGCVLLQAAMGGRPSLADEFPTELWLLAPTPDLKVYPITPRDFRLLVAKTIRYHREHGTLPW